MREETKIKIQLARIIQNKMSSSYKRIVEFYQDDIQVIDWFIEQVEKGEQLQQEIEQLKLEKEATIEGFNEQVKLAADCIEENTRLREQLQQAKAKLERYKEIANLFRIAFANGEAEHRIANGRSMQAMALLEELES